MTGVQRLRVDARAIFLAGVAGSDPAAAVRKALRTHGERLWVGERDYALAEFRKIYIGGAGKAAAVMASATREILAGKVSDGIVVVPRGYALGSEPIAVLEAGHPIPDGAGMEGARRIMKMARQSQKDDLFIFLLSGGASALLPCPAVGLSFDDKQSATRVLLQSGATIHEVNAIRKHLSCVKGGRLAQVCAPARLVCLILSDVIGDSIEAIGSGPTAPDPTTYADCLEIIARYGLADAMPGPALELLARGARGEIAETVKPSDPVFGKVQNFIVANNCSALEAARDCAQAYGYEVSILTANMHGESRCVAEAHSEYVKNIVNGKQRASRPLCLLSGGETTVSVTGTGVGGRNQEFALAAALAIENIRNVVILSGGTDGRDGSTDAAGGIVDGTTIERARNRGLDARSFLERNDSYHLLQAVDDLLMTGPTLTNVMDLQITLVS